MIESEIDRGIFFSRVEADRTAFHQLIDRYISEIAPKHQGAYRDERLKIRKGNTVKRELALVQCAIEVARREWGIHLAENPVRMVSRPKLQRRTLTAARSS